MMTDAPKSAAEPRSGGRPAFIDPNCKACGAPLVLHDTQREQPSPPDEVWHDEWECPSCRDGVYLDVPEGSKAKRATPWAEIRRKRPGATALAPVPQYTTRSDTDLAADPRTQRRPQHIAPTCPTCGAGLVLLDLLFDPVPPDDQIDQDEFLCPVCRDGMYPDEPGPAR